MLTRAKFCLFDPSTIDSPDAGFVAHGNTRHCSIRCADDKLCGRDACYFSNQRGRRWFDVATVRNREHTGRRDRKRYRRQEGDDYT